MAVETHKKIGKRSIARLDEGPNPPRGAVIEALAAATLVSTALFCLQFAFFVNFKKMKSCSRVPREGLIDTTRHHPSGDQMKRRSRLSCFYVRPRWPNKKLKAAPQKGRFGVRGCTAPHDLPSHLLHGACSSGPAAEHAHG